MIMMFVDITAIIMMFIDVIAIIMMFVDVIATLMRNAAAQLPGRCAQRCAETDGMHSAWSCLAAAGMAVCSRISSVERCCLLHVAACSHRPLSNAFRSTSEVAPNKLTSC